MGENCSEGKLVSDPVYSGRSAFWCEKKRGSSVQVSVPGQVQVQVH